MFFTTVNSQCSLQIMLQNVPISESLACTLHLCYLQMVGTPWDIGGRRPGAGLGGSHPENLGATGVEPGGHQHLSSRHLLHQEGGHHLLRISSSLSLVLLASNSSFCSSFICPAFSTWTAREVINLVCSSISRSFAAISSFIFLISSPFFDNNKKFSSTADFCLITSSLKGRIMDFIF